MWPLRHPLTPLPPSPSRPPPHTHARQIPAHKVKLVVGAGGDKIKWIQRKSKCRIQVKKADQELERGFGTGPTMPLPQRGPQLEASADGSAQVRGGGGGGGGGRGCGGMRGCAGLPARACVHVRARLDACSHVADVPSTPLPPPTHTHTPLNHPHTKPQVKMTTLELFGSAEQCDAARALIEEAVENREQKQKQRQKEYEKKKDVSRRGMCLCVCCVGGWVGGGVEDCEG